MPTEQRSLVSGVTPAVGSQCCVRQLWLSQESLAGLNTQLCRRKKAGSAAICAASLVESNPHRACRSSRRKRCSGGAPNATLCGHVGSGITKNHPRKVRVHPGRYDTKNNDTTNLSSIK